MHASLALLLMSATFAPAADSLANFNFATGDPSQWEGAGFRVTAAGASSHVATSQALLHRAFTIPSSASVIRFSAAAIRPSDARPIAILDIYLEAAERRLIPKLVRSGDTWKPVGRLLPPLEGGQREYQWDVSGLRGQLVRVVLLDQDDRPGCFVACGGFKIVRSEDTSIKAFTDVMVKLTTEHQLTPMSRFDSKHFVALSNVDDEFVEQRLHNCETIYDLFFPHFRGKRFTVHEPRGKLMVAIFDSQVGFEAYLGQKMSTAISGIYHTPTNRLVVYDYAGNRSFIESRKKGEREARTINDDLSRQRFLGTLGRRFADFRNDLNVSTIMHEVAHQLSFNSGLFNREGDAPMWLVEGLATYCESTNNGGWGGIGEPNPARTGVLSSFLKRDGGFIPLRDLVVNDDWLRNNRQMGAAALGYAQSWALFRMLMEDRPKDLKKFMTTIYPRRTLDHRLTDFAECFGSDLDQLEKRHLDYIRRVCATH